MRRVGFTGLIGLALLFLVIYLQACLVPAAIIKYVETALKIQISGATQPVWGRFEFFVEPLQTLWDDKIKVNSGRVHVRYGVKELLTGQLHVVISGMNVDAELLGDWVSIAGGQEAVFKDLYADLILSWDGIKEIKALRAESPTLHFRFGEAINRHLKETHEA